MYQEIMLTGYYPEIKGERTINLEKLLEKSPEIVHFNKESYTSIGRIMGITKSHSYSVSFEPYHLITEEQKIPLRTIWEHKSPSDEKTRIFLGLSRIYRIEGDFTDLLRKN